MPTQIDLGAFKRLTRRIEAVGRLDFTPLMKIWGTILHEDNIRGVMRGLDGKGNPLEAVRYRPTDPAKRRKPIDYTILPNNNLTASHYRSLSGPPLAPRGMQSRVITNFRTSTGHDAPDEWHALGAWEDVLDPKGRPFLHRHFTGGGNLPRRDLRGVRPEAMQAARRATRRFLVAYLRSTA